MTEWVEQRICIKFCTLLHKISSTETIQMIQKAAAMGTWWLTASSRQRTHSCITSCAVFCETSNHPGNYSPDLTSCDFWLFPNLKSPLKGKRFQTNDEIQENTMGHLMAIPPKDFAEDFEQWKSRWENCVRSQGIYLEGDWGVIVLCTVCLVSCIFFSKCLLFFIVRGWILSGRTLSCKVPLLLSYCMTLTLLCVQLSLVAW